MITKLSERHAPLAQLDRASGYGPEGRGFESLTAYQKSSKSSDFEDFCFSIETSEYVILKIFQAYSFPHTNASVLRRVYGETESKVNRYDREK